MNTKKQLFIRGDLNEFYDGKLPLRNNEVINQIKIEYGEIKDGLKIWLFELTVNNGKYDPTIFQGTIKKNKGELEIFVNESDMLYLSESEQFKDYGIEDVLGTEWFRKLKARYPDRI